MSEEFPWHFSLAGFESRYCYKRQKSKNEVASNVPFPAEAFAKILHDKGLAIPVEWDRRFSFQQKEDSSVTNNETEEQKSAIVETLASDDMQVVDGITVEQIRGLLDEKNEGTTFCPVLLAAVRTALEVADRRKKIGPNWSFSAESSFAKKIADKRCVELGILTADSSAKGREKDRPSNADKDAVARCSRLTRMQSKR